MSAPGRKTGAPSPAALAAFFGLNAGVMAMMVTVVLVGLGEKMAERFLPLYIVALGGSALAVSSLNALDNFLSAVYSLIGGFVSDRLGYKKALVAFTALALFGYLIVILIPDWRAVLVGSVFFIAWTAISLPAIMSLVTSAVAANKRTMGTTVHSFVRRIPMALGPLIGGFVIAALGERNGLIVAFTVAFVLGLISIFVILRFMPEPVRKPGLKAAGFLDGLRGLRGRLGVLLLSDTLVRFAEHIPYPFVVIWVVTNKGLGEASFGILTAIEMATAMLVYIPVAYLADRGSKKPFVAATFAFFSIFPLILLFSGSFATMVLAFIVRGLKEFGEPTRKTLINELAPEATRAVTFGTYYLIRDIAVSIAALLAGLLWSASPALMFVTASCFGLAGFLVFLIFGSDAGRVGGVDAQSSS